MKNIWCLSESSIKFSPLSTDKKLDFLPHPCPIDANMEEQRYGATPAG
jgi:hypothetical protein